MYIFNGAGRNKDNTKTIKYDRQTEKVGGREMGDQKNASLNKSVFNLFLKEL